MPEISPELSLFVLILIFVISLIVLIKGADALLWASERIGKYFKLPAFVIGALIIGIGTSLPELASSLAAVFAGETSIVAANAVGSNIANILLVAGLAAVIGKVIISVKDLANLEIPLLVISTSLFIFVAYDGIINTPEALIISIAFVIYVLYLLYHKEYDAPTELKKETEKDKVKKIGLKEVLFLVGGAIFLALGANFLISSLIAISTKANIAPDIIALSAVAVGTSLPEIIVSVKAVLRGKTDMAFGNVFGSNVFNMLMITGIAGLFANLKVDEVTLSLGLPFLAITTLIFYVSAATKKIYIWEGLMFLLFYILFSLKIFGII